MSNTSISHGMGRLQTRAESQVHPESTEDLRPGVTVDLPARNIHGVRTFFPPLPAHHIISRFGKLAIC
jgi:hypothetical protein